MKRTGRLLGLLSIVIFVGISALRAFAMEGDSPLRAEIPNYFSTLNSSTLFQHSLGETCSILSPERQIVPCNPAFQGEQLGRTESPGRFSAQIYAGKDVERVSQIKKLVDKEKWGKLADDLYTKDPITEMEANSAIDFGWRSVGLSVSPYRLNYFSVAHDSANPTLAVHAMEEKSLSLQFGHRFSEYLRAGIRVRGVQRRFVHDEFSLFELAAEPEKQLIPQTQEAVFVEPGLSFQAEGQLKPTFSFLLMNTGYIDKKVAGTPINPALLSGFSIEPATRVVKWQLGSSYRWEADQDPSLDHFRVSSIVGYQDFSSSLSWSPKAFTVGFFGQTGVLSAGLVYEENTFADDGMDQIKHHGYFVQFSLIL